MTRLHRHLRGKVERSHRIDDQKFYQLLDQDGISDDIHLFNEKLREWEDYYNYHRLHGALQGQTPFERLIEKSRADVSLGSSDPTPGKCKVFGYISRLKQGQGLVDTVPTDTNAGGFHGILILQCDRRYCRYFWFSISKQLPKQAGS